MTWCADSAPMKPRGFPEELERTLAAVSSAAVPWELSSNAPVSIRAEEAWRITRGSPDVVVAIIDDGFDRSWLPPESLIDIVTVHSQRYTSTLRLHGTLVAGLIAGTRFGYPGVAPGCRLLGIELPSYCTAAEEAQAFELALEANAAVVCCAWGPAYRGPGVFREMAPRVAHAVERCAAYSRGGLGSAIFFAVGCHKADVRLDGYARHPAVTAVGGITYSGNRSSGMDDGSFVVLAAPVSDSEARIGGQPGVPPGCSGSVGLASGVAGLMFSARRNTSAKSAISILLATATAELSAAFPAPPQKSRQTAMAISSAGLHPVIDAGKAVAEALAASARPTFENLSLASSMSPKRPSPCGFHQRESRFNGGEHTLLGSAAVCAVRNQYRNSLGDPYRAFFEDIFAPYTPTLTKKPEFSSPINDHLLAFLLGSSTQTDPAIVISGQNPFPFKYLLGLAGDLYGCPPDLWADLNSDRVAGFDRAIDSFVQEFDKELNDLTYNSDFALSWWASVVPAWLPWGTAHAHYLGLASKNSSHFAGENLLFYLSYHLLAVTYSAHCSSVSTEEELSQYFHRALLCEAFAAHFLTDTFSAGHGRVPRRAFIDQFPIATAIANQLSRFLHNYEGDLGIFFTNSLRYIWYAYGDGKVLVGASPRYVSAFSLESGQLEPFLNSSEALNVLPLLYPSKWSSLKDEPLGPCFLSATLVFASLVDVIRHMATGYTIEASCTGSGNNGLLGYILARLPYALPTRPFDPSLESELRRRFGDACVSRAALSDRLGRTAVRDVYDAISSPTFMGPFASTRRFDDFVRWTYDEYLCPERLADFATLQASYCDEFFKTESPAFLSPVPSVVSQYVNLPTTLVSPYTVENIPVPPTWKKAVPRLMTEAFRNVSGGIWGLDK